MPRGPACGRITHFRIGSVMAIAAMAVPAVCDGAVWIAEQIALHFGAQSHNLVDFDQVSDNRAATAPSCGGVEAAREAGIGT